MRDETDGRERPPPSPSGPSASYLDGNGIELRVEDRAGDLPRDAAGGAEAPDAVPARRRRALVRRARVRRRHPDENHERVYRWLLERNLKLYGVAFAVDHLGDIYLDGRLPLSSVTADEVDRLLGSVLTYADESFNTILELGFASSIRKEWEWRISRGESTAQPRGVPRLARGRRPRQPAETAGSRGGGVRRRAPTIASARRGR